MYRCVRNTNARGNGMAALFQSEPLAGLEEVFLRRPLSTVKKDRCDKPWSKGDGRKLGSFDSNTIDVGRGKCSTYMATGA